MKNIVIGILVFVLWIVVASYPPSPNTTDNTNYVRIAVDEIGTALFCTVSDRGYIVTCWEDL